VSVRETVLHDADSFRTLIRRAQRKVSEVFLLCDENTQANCLPHVEKTYLAENELKLTIATIPAGEASKTLEHAQAMWDRMIEGEVDRDALFIALGGGVVTDLGGFIASAYKRGIRLIHIPTTHLAMTDAALGGKNGINYGGLKNQIGALYHPWAIVIDPQFLSSLPIRELQSGWIETVKHALIADRALWNQIKDNPWEEASLDHHILNTSAQIKLNIAAADEGDHGIRQSLNFGHTIGHALEAQQSLLHGEAVAFGIIAELYLSKQILGAKSEEIDAILTYLKPYHPRISNLDINEDTMLRSMLNDKKNRGGRIRFSLISQIGQAEVGITASDEMILKAIAFAQQKVNT
jgi:3-dehydroquinate synthase